MVGVKDTDYATAAEFKTAMSGVMLDYELAVPETLATYPSVLSSPLHKIGDIVDYKESNGKEVHNFGVVDLGSLKWTYNNSANRSIFSHILQDAAHPEYFKVCNARCALYNAVSQSKSWVDKDMAINIDGKLSIVNNDYTDAASFKAAMQGVMLVYELATPTEVQGEPLPRLAIPKAESIVTLDTQTEPSNITAKV